MVALQAKLPILLLSLRIHSLLGFSLQRPLNRLTQARYSSADTVQDESASKVPYRFHHHSKNETYLINLEISRLAKQAESNRTSPLIAQKLLRNAQEPDTVTYNGVLKAFTTSPHYSPEDAQSILKEMEQASQNQRREYEEGVRQDITIRPNVVSYSTVMNAWCQAGDPFSAHALLNRLERMYQATNDPCLKPNIISYNTVLNAYSKSALGEVAAEKAEALLHEMPEWPDVYSYNSVLQGWARAKNGERAQKILSEMKHQGIQPNERSYTSVIDAWSRSNHPEQTQRADALLQECIDVGLEPNVYVYSTAITAWAHSREPNKAQRAYSLLQEVAKPTIVTYNAVLNACATSSPSEVTNVQEIVDMICEKVGLNSVEDSNNNNNNKINNEVKPDQVTFGSLLKICGNVFCGQPYNEERVERIFAQACAAGQVSHGVCYQFRQAAPSQLYSKTIPQFAIQRNNGHFDIRKLPTEWTKNVRNERRSRHTST